MPETSDSLRHFLVKVLNRQDYELVLELLEPFYAVIRRKAWELKPGDEVPGEEVKDALGKVLLQRPHALIFISAAKITPRSYEWDDDEEADLSERSLAVKYHKTARLLPHSKFNAEVQDGLNGLVCKSLAYPLQDLMETWWPGRTEPTKEYLWLTEILSGNISDTLYLFLTRLLVGERDEAEKFIPLIRFFPRLIPVLEEKGRPGSWQVLAR